jgi:hypothetical protein
MPMSVASQAAFLRGARVEFSREGRDCDRSRQATVLVLFPFMDARPGPWLLLLTAACSFVAIRALEMFSF